MLRGATTVTGSTLSTTVLAPAKLNLVLAVGPPRRDGYHEVVSVMQAIDLCDTLQVDVDLAAPGDPRASHEERIVAVEAPGLAGGDTIVSRALEALSIRSGINLCVRVRIDKRIPAGAGLGGGSSDGAAALRVVNEMLGTLIEGDALLKVAGMVGSDLPFFFSASGSAVMSGRGEVLHEVPALRPRSWLVAWPGRQQSTAEVYERFEYDGARLPSRSQVLEWVNAGLFRNDLERAACTGASDTAELVMQLREAGASPFVVGSGSAVAAPLPAGDDVAARDLTEVARLAGASFVTVARSCDGFGVAYPDR